MTETEKKAMVGDCPMSEKKEHNSYLGYLLSDVLMRNGHWAAVADVYDELIREDEEEVQYYFDWLLPLHWARMNGDTDKLPKFEEYKATLLRHAEAKMRTCGRENEIDQLLRGVR